MERIGELQDELAQKTIAQIELFPVRPEYDGEDIVKLLSEDFRVRSLVARLFLGVSKDSYETALINTLGNGGVGVKRFGSDQARYVSALKDRGLLTALQAVVNREFKWSDELVERLRSGRESAVSGQRRGRHVEDFAEVTVKKVFGANYDTRCNFAITTKDSPRIVTASKGYGAPGSKMTDVIGAIEKIMTARRADMVFIFFTDGVS